MINSPRKGFTLLELLIYMSVLSIVILFVSGSFTSVNQGRGRGTARAEVSSAMRFVFDQMHQDIQGATGVTTPRYGKIVTCSATTSCLLAVVGPDIITYDVSDGQIRRKVNSGTANPITPTTVNVTALSVEYFGNNNAAALTLAPAFQVSMTAAYNSTSPDYQYSETKQSTFAQVLTYSTTTRGSIIGASSGTCLVILGIPICL